MFKKNKMASWSLILFVLAILILVSSSFFNDSSFMKNINLFNSIKLKSQLNSSNNEVEKLIKEKNLLKLELEAQLQKYKDLEIENETFTKELQVKHTEIKALIQKIDSLEKDVIGLLSLKKELIANIKKYKNELSQKIKLESKEPKEEIRTTINNSNINNPENSSKFSNQLDNSPIKNIEKNPNEKIRILNPSVQTYYKKKSGEKKLTSNFSKMNNLEIEFSIYSDTNDKKVKFFYFQIFDTNNKNIGETKRVYLNSKELIYSYISSIEYDNNMRTVKEEISTEGLNLGIGLYFLNIFSENGQLLCSKSFKLD